MHSRTAVLLVVLGAGCAGCGGGDGDVKVEATALTATCSSWDPQITPGVLCTPDDPNFLEFRYPEHIAYCKRNVSMAEKKRVAANYGVAKSEFSSYEFDHLIPLAIGGSDDDENIWPQPLADASDKDKLELELYYELKSGSISQKDAVATMLAWNCN